MQEWMGVPFHVPVLQAEQPQLTVSDTELDSLLEHVAYCSQLSLSRGV